jgi:phosphoribosylpyrophosphate synthetase
MFKLLRRFMGIKDIAVFQTACYPLLNDIDGLRDTACNISRIMKEEFWSHAKICLVGCGTSGATLMTAISLVNEMDACLISKGDSEVSHRTSTTLNLDHYNYLVIVDDRIETGATINRIASVLTRNDYHLKVKMVCAKWMDIYKSSHSLTDLFPNLKYICY